MVAVEIDDLLMFGDALHDDKMRLLRERFTFGKIEKMGPQGVNFNGGRLRKVDGNVLIDMKAFVEERLEIVALDKDRLKASVNPSQKKNWAL